ncbi:DUF551 domain-containing protein [Enterobacter ludwigii]
MSTITKESIVDTIEGLEQLTNRGIQSVYIDMAIAGMRRLQASLEAEPVYQFIYNNPYEEGYTEWLDCNKDYFNGVPEDCRRILYTAPPAPVSVPDEVNVLLNHLEDVLPDDAFNKIDVKTWNNVSMLSRHDVYRTAVLQGAEPVTTAYKSPSLEHFISLCNQFWNWQEADEINAGEEEPRLEWNGSQFTHRVTQALWRMYQASPGNYPVIPDGWVACSERMPNIGVPVITCCGDVVQYAAYAWDGKEWQDWYEEYDKLPASTFTHWMPRPAAPQQEVKNG